MCFTFSGFKLLSSKNLISCLDDDTHRGAMSIWLMKTPAALNPPVVIDSVRKVTMRMWLQPA